MLINNKILQKSKQNNGKKLIHTQKVGEDSTPLSKGGWRFYKWDCKLFIFYYFSFLFTLLWYLINFIIYNIIVVWLPRLICMDITSCYLFFKK
jgi:hypothetical protein